MKVAVFDLGSNTTKLLVAEVDDHAPHRILAEVSRPCRLTTGRGEEFRFPEKSIERLLEVLEELTEIAREHEVERMEAVATEAFRRSKNSQDLILLAKNSLGLDISILSGLEEAGAIATGLLCDPLISELDDFHAIDLGGGSMEVIIVEERTVTSTESFPLGAAVLSNRFCTDPGSPWSKQVCEDAKNYVRCFLNKADAPVLSTPCSTLVGAGGTLVFLRKILENESAGKRKENGVLELPDSIGLFERISQMNLSQRLQSYPDLPPSRADIFPAGLLAVNEIMRYFKQTKIAHSYQNLRHGIARKLALRPKGNFLPKN